MRQVAEERLLVQRIQVSPIGNLDQLLVNIQWHLAAAQVAMDRFCQLASSIRERNLVPPCCSAYLKGRILYKGKPPGLVVRSISHKPDAKRINTPIAHHKVNLTT